MEQETQIGDIILDSNSRSIEAQAEGGARGRDPCAHTPPMAEQGGGGDRSEDSAEESTGWTTVDRARRSSRIFRRPTVEEATSRPPPPGFQGQAGPCPPSNNPYQHLDSDSETSPDSSDQSYTSYSSEEQELDSCSESEGEGLEIGTGRIGFGALQGRLGRVVQHVDNVFDLHASTNPNLNAMHAKMGVTNLSLTSSAEGRKKGGSKKGGGGQPKRKREIKRGVH